jgi:hypothetical protein
MARPRQPSEYTATTPGGLPKRNPTGGRVATRAPSPQDLTEPGRTVNGLPRRVSRSIKNPDHGEEAPGMPKPPATPEEERAGHEQLLADLDAFAAGEQEAKQAAWPDAEDTLAADPVTEPEAAAAPTTEPESEAPPTDTAAPAVDPPAEPAPVADWAPAEEPVTPEALVVEPMPESPPAGGPVVEPVVEPEAAVEPMPEPPEDRDTVAAPPTSEPDAGTGYEPEPRPSPMPRHRAEHEDTELAERYPSEPLSFEPLRPAAPPDYAPDSMFDASADSTPTPPRGFALPPEQYESEQYESGQDGGTQR